MKTNRRSITRTVLPALVSLGLLALAGLPALHARPGDLDPTFGTGGKVTTAINLNASGKSLTVQADGKILVAGNADNAFALVRYQEDGSLDPGFGTGGIVTTFVRAGGSPHSVAVQSDGTILVAGEAMAGGRFQFAVVRYTATGAPDERFGSGGERITPIGSSSAFCQGMALQSDGKILLAGYYFTGGHTELALVRYNADGSLDTGFNGTGIVTTPIGTASAGQSVAVQSDGKILVAGYSSNGTDLDFTLARYHADVATGTPGTPDAGFGPGGIVTTPIGSASEIAYSMAVQGDGKILLAGNTNDGTTAQFALVRYHADGSLDTGFNGTGKVTTPIGSSFATGTSVAVQGDGRILVAGIAFNGTDNDFALVRYRADGSLDTSLNGTGKVTTPIGSGEDSGSGVAVQSDGKILVAGTAASGSYTDFALVRYQGVVTRDFNNDGNADLLFQNTLGQIYAWYLDGSGVISSSDYLFTGALGDWKIAGAADMNNDGNSDIVFQNNAGQIYVWYLNGSGVVSSGAFLFPDGLGDWRIKGIADLDNDGHADLIFQNTFGQIFVWYLNGSGVVSSGAYLFTGGLGDWRIAGIADLNNDGHADLVFQNTFGQIYVWYLDGSGVVSSSAYLFTSGLADWRIAGIADMNNDGHADLIFQNVIGQIYVWYLNGSGVVSSSAYLFTGGLGDWRIR
jgi:uncharacterized delta-60 repeat protein